MQRSVAASSNSVKEGIPLDKASYQKPEELMNRIQNQDYNDP